MTLRCTPIATRDEWEASTVPGAVTFFNGVGDYADRTYMGMRCPCGCGRRDILPVRQGADVGRGWGWDGDDKNPTITPSVNLLDLIDGDANKSHWHGFLTAGEWRTA